jgi:hypothetical protein
MKTTDELVRELADREAIRELPMRYCDCLYRKELVGLVSLFTDTGVFSVKDREHEVSTKGRARLRKMYEKLVSELQPRPLVHSHVIELLGANKATGRCYVEMRSAKLEVEPVGSGCYEDEYVKVGEQWKFASRRLVEINMATSLRVFMVS